MLLEKDVIQNVGTVDRGIRILVGVALIAASLLGYIGAWGWVGVIPLATGLFRFYPCYLPVGLSIRYKTLGVATYMGGGPSLMYAASAIAAFDEFSHALSA